MQVVLGQEEFSHLEAFEAGIPEGDRSGPLRSVPRRRGSNLCASIPRNRPHNMRSGLVSLFRHQSRRGDTKTRLNIESFLVLGFSEASIPSTRRI
jgi:hypothetical protein